MDVLFRRNSFQVDMQTGINQYHMYRAISHSEALLLTFHKVIEVGASVSMTFKILKILCLVTSAYFFRLLLLILF